MADTEPKQVESLAEYAIYLSAESPTKVELVNAFVKIQGAKDDAPRTRAAWAKLFNAFASAKA